MSEESAARWRSGLSQEAREALDEWLERVLHDLVKYLEMMPRSLDWGALEDEDWDIVWESIVETRSGPRGVRSAGALWEEAAGALPEAVRAAGPVPGWEEVGVRVARLMAFAEGLEAEGPPEAAAEVEAVRADVFGIGEALRALRASG